MAQTGFALAPLPNNVGSWPKWRNGRPGWTHGRNHSLPPSPPSRFSTPPASPNASERMARNPDHESDRAGGVADHAHLAPARSIILTLSAFRVFRIVRGPIPVIPTAIKKTPHVTVRRCWARGSPGSGQEPALAQKITRKRARDESPDTPSPGLTGWWAPWSLGRISVRSVTPGLRPMG